MLSKFTTLKELVKLCEILAEKLHALFLLAFWIGLFLRLLAGPQPSWDSPLENTIQCFGFKSITLQLVLVKK